jgi:hypothetical protein
MAMYLTTTEARNASLPSADEQIAKHNAGIVPTGMRVVSRDEFFKILYADSRDIMPSQNDPYFTSWETRNGVVFGRTTPGWKNPGDAATYMVTR